MRTLVISFFLLYSICCSAADTLKISPDIYLLKVSEETYIHVSWHSDPDWGKFTCNGLLILKNGKAALFDTPMSDSLTRKLISFVQDSLHSKIELFAPNHWHADCTEGMDILDSIGVKTYSSVKTAEYSKSHNIIQAKTTFADTITLFLEGKKIFLEYPGAGHTRDNIVTWIPDEKILFGGCMIRAKKSSSTGNIADADLTAWPKTIKKLKKKYEDAKVVVPGHGDYGSTELFTHTIKLTTKKPKGK